MDLYIHTLTGTAFELRVSPFETIMSIKAKIQRLEGKKQDYSYFWAFEVIFLIKSWIIFWVNVTCLKNYMCAM
jgi:hypothetical protein